MTRLISLFCLVTLLATAVAAAADKQVLTETMVRTAVTDYLQRRTARQGVEIRITSLSYRGEAALPAGSVSYEILAPQDWEGWGHGSLALIVRVDGLVAKNIPVNVAVEALGDVVVTTRSLEYGAQVSRGDVVLQKRDLATVTGRICRTLDEAIGKRVRVALRSNVPVREEALEKMPVVKSGQLVTIVIENDAFRITATGRARGNGAEGDTVMVQNMEAQKTLPATVVDANTVRVEF